MFESLTLERFLDFASNYNLDLYPVQYLMLGLGITGVFVGIFAGKYTSWTISAILGFFYAWIGIAFYLKYFAEFMPVPVLFAVLFLIQALLFILEGIVRNRLVFRFRPDIYGLTGALLIFYALFGNQALEYVLGRGYPQILSFGLFPCPTVIFSLGILLWTDKKFPAYILIFPLINALSGFIPAFLIGIIEDIGLIISGLLVLLMIGARDKWLFFRNIKKEGP
jgi:hypothetical protein